MSGNSMARDFLAAIRDSRAEKSSYTPSQDRPAKIGVVQSILSTGLVLVLIDGETVAGSKGYAVVEPVTVGARVVLLPVGRSYVVLGPIGGANRGTVVDYGAVSFADTVIGATTATLGAQLSPPALPYATVLLFSVAGQVGMGSGTRPAVNYGFTSTVGVIVNDSAQVVRGTTGVVTPVTVAQSGQLPIAAGATPSVQLRGTSDSATSTFYGSAWRWQRLVS